MAQPTTSFYRRPLPENLPDLSSTRGKELFAQAMVEGHTRCFFPLVSQFHTQTEPAFCALSTLVMALNAFEIDPGRVWKGAWRWYSEEMLSCCCDLEVVKKEGLTLPQLTKIAACNGLLVDTHFGSECSLDEMRQLIKHTCWGASLQQSFDSIIVVSYNRARLGQTGTGHFSPIGAYNEQSDMVLLFDVARFKYPPHWVPMEMLYQSTVDIDQASGKSRGLLVMRPMGRLPSYMCLIVSSPNEIQRWITTAAQQVNQESCLNVEGESAEHDEVVVSIARALEPEFYHHIKPLFTSDDVFETACEKTPTGRKSCCTPPEPAEPTNCCGPISANDGIEALVASIREQTRELSAFSAVLELAPYRSDPHHHGHSYVEPSLAAEILLLLSMAVMPFVIGERLQHLSLPRSLPLKVAAEVDRIQQMIANITKAATE